MSLLKIKNLRAVLPIFLGAMLFVLGLYALFHLLRPVNPAAVKAQLKGTPIPVLVAALGATGVGYAALIFYDWFALRFIGQKLPKGVVALGGYLGYAFGNTIGVSVISGGAVRYRIYSALGLSAFEVAAISGYIAVTLGTGLTIIGLGALALHPAVFSDYFSLSSQSVQLISGGIFTVSAVAILWLSVGQHKLQISRFTLRLPPLKDLAGQLLATSVDVAAASFALWILLPAGKPDFATFIAVYAAATMIGVLSHVPGGVGVFETVVIGTLPQTVQVGDAAAALLLFRLIYYIVPFALAFLFVAANEVRSASGPMGRLFRRLPASSQNVLGSLHGIAPGLVATVTFGFGVYLLLVTMIPSLQAGAVAEGDLAGALLIEGGTIASAIAGVVLLILSHAMARRISAAFWLAVAAMLAAAIGALANDLDIENAAFLIVGVLSVLPFRKAFYRQGRLTNGMFETRWILMILAVALVTLAFFFFMHQAVPYSNDLWSEFSRNSATPRSLRAGLVASAVLFFFGIYQVLAPARRKPRDAMDDDSVAKAALIALHSCDPHAWLSQTGDKRFHFSDTGRSFLMYGINGRSWVAFGDPVGEEAEFSTLCWSFAEAASHSNCRPVFYEVSANKLPLWVDLGFAVNKIGEEAIVDLKEFSLTGSKFKSMRAALNKRKRDGYEFLIMQPPHSSELITQLKEISDDWLQGKTGKEKGFSVGRFDPDYLENFDIGIIRKDDRIIAFTNLLFSHDNKNIAIDLMRFRTEDASGMIEYMFLCLIEHYQQADAAEFSLGMAPLSGLSKQSIAKSWNRHGKLIYRHGDAFYNFEGLRAFKQKFQPTWRTRYLAVPPGTSPLFALGDVALLIAGGPKALLVK